MDERSLEELFERWRARGDVAALAAVFDRTAPQLLALGVHLVRDSVEAEDLVQETFRAALEGAHGFDGTRRLEPWLAGILVHQSQRLRRERMRRPDPERLVRATASDPARAAEERELAGALADALAELDEPYRSVLAQHLRGERPLDIARASGRAPGTVRMQILRGLERLRRLLPAGMFAAVPVRLPRGLAGLRAEVLGHGAGAASVSTGVAIGGMTMSIKAVAGVAVACGLALVVFLRSGDGERAAASHATAAEEEPARVASGDARAQEEALVPARTVEAPRESAESSPVSAPAREHARAAKEPGLWLVGRLLGVAVDPAATGIKAATATGYEARGEGSADATYALDLTELVQTEQAGSLRVTATHVSGRRAELDLSLTDAMRAVGRDERVELVRDLELTARTAVIGRVACDGEPTSVEVALSQGDWGLAAKTTTCDARGRFALFPERLGTSHLLAVCRGYLPASLELDVRRDQVIDVGTLRLDQGGAAIEGRLALGFEPPLDGATLTRIGSRLLPGAPALRVRAERELDDDTDYADFFDSVRVYADRIVVRAGSARVGADGAFRISGLEPGEYALALECEDGDLLVLSEPAAEVVAPATGVVFGRDYGLLTVDVRGADGGDVRASFGVANGTYSTTNPAGEPFRVIADRRLALTIGAKAQASLGAELASPPNTRELVQEIELELTRGDALAALEVEWSLPPGISPPTHLRGEWSRGEESGELQIEASATSCLVRDLAPGHCRFTLEPAPDARGDTVTLLWTPSFEVELEAGRTAHVRVAWESGGRVRLVPDIGGRTTETAHARVLDALGVEQPVRFAQHEFRDGTLHCGTYTGSMPLMEPNELEPTLLPGAYVLVLSDRETELLRVPFTIVAGAIVDVPFVLP